MLKKLNLIALCLFVLFSGCERTEPEKTDEEAKELKREMSEAYEATGEYLSEQKKELLERSSETYNRLKNDTQQLITDVKESGKTKWEELNAEYELEEKLADARQKLAELEDAGKENLENTKNAFDTAVDELVDAYQKAKAEYQKTEVEN